jgi:hypothetical protein
MRAQITPTKIKRNGSQPITASGSDVYVDLVNCELFKQGTVLAVLDLTTGTEYTTDFAWTSVAAILAAAPGSGSFFVLT